MKKRLLVTLSTMLVSACAVMTPDSVQAMRTEALPKQDYSLFIDLSRFKMDANAITEYDIGRCLHNAACKSDFERIREIDSFAKSHGKNMVEELKKYYKGDWLAPSFLSYCNDPELVNFAVENGLNELIDRPDFNGQTPLMTTSNTEVARLLIANGANVNRRTWNHHETPLFFVETGEMAQLLIDNGAVVNHENTSGTTPLFRAQTGEIAQVLIDNGATVDHKDGAGCTPLFEARTGEIAQILIDNGADVNHKSVYGQTPIGRTWETEVARVLLDNGATADCNDFCIRYNSNREIVQLIEERNRKVADSKI